MENKSKKSKAFLITIILILLLVLGGYLLYKNKDAFGVKTSSSISKIFSPLITKDNTKDLNKIDAEAGEEIKKGDNVSSMGTSANGNPIVMKTTDGNIFGYADEDINSGNTGKIVLNEGRTSNFWDSFSGFLGDFFGGDVVIETCTNNATNPPLCTTIGDTCINDANNPPTCDSFGEITCPNGAVNPPICDNFIDTQVEGPDLTVTENITPITTTVNTPTVLKAMVANIGTEGTGHSFVNLFTISKNLDVELTKTKDLELSIIIPTLESGVGSPAQLTHTFTEEGTYSIRLCADRSPVGENTGITIESVTEANENNNCGQTIVFTVTNALPQPGELPQCSDTIDNDDDNKIDIDDPNCHTGGDINNTYVSSHNSETSSPIDPNTSLPQCSDIIDNDGDGDTDKDDSNCNVNGTYIPSHTSEENSPAGSNVCLDIDANPLVFTEQEKADLAILLRKFYLLAPTLKTQDDIDIAYNEMAQYKNFSDYLTTITNQCYAEGIDRNGIVNPNYTGPTIRWGNPWYKYSTLRGSYLEKDDFNNFVGIDCKYVSGWFSGKKASDGEDCDYYNQQMYNPTLGGIPASCSSSFTDLGPSGITPVSVPGEPSPYAGPGYAFQKTQFNLGKEDKCVWHAGVNIDNLEKILNVW